MHIRLFALVVMVLVLGACSQMTPQPGPSLSPAGPAPQNYSYVSQWGTEGSGDGQFDAPYSIAIDSLGNVYVLDRYNNRIQKFTSTGSFITKWGEYGSGDGQFDEATGIAIDSSDNVYVVDRYNARIQKFTSSGSFITEWGDWGSDDGEFYYPYGIAVDSNDDVYVMDTENFRIQKFSPKGTFITKWGSEGSGDGQFDYAYGVAIDSSDNVYVADNDNDRIQKFSSTGVFITSWGTTGDGNGQFDSPTGITVDSSDDVYVTDRSNDRIQKFTSSGSYITQWGEYGSGDGEFDSPRDVAVNSSGTVYVVDRENNRIQTFAIGNNEADTYTINFETAPANKILYVVKVGQGVVYQGEGTANTDSIRVDGFRYQGRKKLGGNQVKVINVSGNKVLTVVKAGTNTPNPTGGELDIKPAQSFGGPSQGKNGLVTLKSITVNGVNSNGAKLVLYGNGKPIKTIALSRTPTQTLALNEPGVGFIQVRANDDFTIDDVVFDVARPD